MSKNGTPTMLELIKTISDASDALRRTFGVEVFTVMVETEKDKEIAALIREMVDLWVTVSNAIITYEGKPLSER